MVKIIAIGIVNLTSVSEKSTSSVEVKEIHQQPQQSLNHRLKSKAYIFLAFFIIIRNLHHNLRFD